MTRNPLACPRCHSKRVAPIAYGLPPPDTVEPFLAAVYNDAIVIGGGVIRDDAPEWYCQECGHEWSRVRSAPHAA